jgi:two-component system, NarL family, nitrate/nitrite response regulator NarL
MTKTTNIYLVDDHQMIIDGIKAMFTGHAHFNFIGESNDGLSAYDAIALIHESIDMVITDINMAGISGIELCRKIKDNFPHIKVLIITMYQNQSVVTESLMAEADGYLLKTAGKNDFELAIDRVMDGCTYYSDSILPIILKEYKKEVEKATLTQHLTARELEVLKLIILEKTSSEIAEELFISIKTVGHHRQNLLSKCNCKSSIGLTIFSIKAGLYV